MTLLDNATEAEFQTLVIDYARLMGWRVAHFRPAQNGRGEWSTPMEGDPGFPDLVLARDGDVVFAELKSEKGRLRTHQQMWLDALDNGGPRSFLWRPSDWETIKTRLAR